MPTTVTRKEQSSLKEGAFPLGFCVSLLVEEGSEGNRTNPSRRGSRGGGGVR